MDKIIKCNGKVGLSLWLLDANSMGCSIEQSVFGMQDGMKSFTASGLIYIWSISSCKVELSNTAATVFESMLCHW